MPTVTEASWGVNSILKWEKEFGSKTPLEGETVNCVNLKV